MGQYFRAIQQKFWSAVMFYTIVPVPARWGQDFVGIVRFAPGVGMMLGLGLGLLETGLQQGGMPNLTRCGLIVALWLGLTGGLHLDGAMDTADGLAVGDPQRRLAVMADSRTGAFGVMVAVVILGLKVLGLSEIDDSSRGLVLGLAAAWGRWGQWWAIAWDPYLKSEGKGAFHKLAMRSIWDAVPGALVLFSISGFVSLWDPTLMTLAWGLGLGGCGCALGIGRWLRCQLGGQTGDTYGAIVEWTEVAMICLAAGLSP
ncbi:MAG: adenosylcobinamide-GDP ribazoletransferase [Synechococcales bacterium]|nr:adenosylcobinamide-GDP ribazoletransferase [Synechococcales bacterium]